jgi:glycosyltransferase involved in cell wall biosynthesis
MPLRAASAPTRILHVIPSLPVGGAEMMLLRLLAATVPDYCQAVVSMKDEGAIGPQLRDLGVAVYCMGLTGPAYNYLRTLSVIPLVRRFRPDLLVGWMYHGNLMASLMSWRTPMVWGIHHSVANLADEPWKTGALIRLGARFSSRPARIVYVSETSKRQHEALGYSRSKDRVIPNGIDDSVFIPDDNARLAARSELGIAEDSILVGLVARYHPMKDHAGFLRTAALVLAAAPSARFLLVGRGIPDQPQLLRLISELGIQDRVVLLGERGDTPRLISALDIACSASAWGEACSVAIGEAMSSGVPCVVTDVGDNAHLVGNTGLSVPPRQPEALAQAICQLISAGRAQRHELGRSARLRIQEHYSLASTVSQYKEVYRECLVESGDRVIG